jgi:hypothetical protein
LPGGKKLRGVQMRGRRLRAVAIALAGAASVGIALAIALPQPARAATHEQFIEMCRQAHMEAPASAARSAIRVKRSVTS